MYLIDTNIFLEILLAQDKRELCKGFLTENAEHLSVSDFALHSIGVILFRNKKDDIFHKFVLDVLPGLSIVTLRAESYGSLQGIRQKYGLDFDDSYQFAVALEHELRIVTMDEDFKKVQGDAKINFL